ACTFTACASSSLTFAWLPTRVAPTYSATSYRCENVRRLRVASALSASRCSRQFISCVVARLPAERITNTRSPRYSYTCSFRYTRTSWKEPLVRVSAANTRPSFTSMATQYVMVGLDNQVRRKPPATSGRDSSRIGTRGACQMSRQYSMIVRSDENLPLRAQFNTDIRVHVSVASHAAAARR